MQNTEKNEIPDAIGNTAVIQAAAKQDWETVRRLMKDGADVRHKNTMGINALYYAVIFNNAELALELYEAGARLDALNSPDAMPETAANASAVLCMAADFRRLGYDLFYDEKNTLAECCQWCEYAQASGKTGTASAEELTEAIAALIRHGRYLPEENLRLIKEMVGKGGKIDSGLIDRYSAKPVPPPLRNPDDYTAALRELSGGSSLKNVSFACVYSTNEPVRWYLQTPCGVPLEVILWAQEDEIP